jgi:signal transduction histidine kinase
MTPTSQDRQPRDALPFIAGAALLVLAWMALGATSAHNQQVRQMVAEELRDELREHASSWEFTLQKHLDDALFDVRTSGTLAETQDRLRRRHRWMDSIYVWTRDSAPLVTSSNTSQLLFPIDAQRPSSPADLACIAATGRAASTGSVDAIEATRRDHCGASPISTHVFAIDEAARRLAEQGRIESALGLLDRLSVLEVAPLTARRGDPLTLRALVERRALRGQLQRARGDTSGARATLSTLLEDTFALEATVLEVTMPTIQRALYDLAAVGADTSALQPRLSASEARVDGWRYVQGLLNRPGSAASSESARFELHLVGDNPWVLYWIPPENGSRGAALLMQPSRLIEDFLRAESGRYRNALVMRDPTRRVVAGAVNEADAPETSVGFGSALSHVTVSFTRSYADQRIDPLLDGWWTWRNGVTLFCIVLGFGAVLMITRAERQHRELLRRQREFTTRITHELKTPVAGMRVMAENLASRAWRDADQATGMAVRIMQEADRLTARINEVLQLSQKREIPPMEPVDLEELLLEAIDEWGPRYEQAGIALEADMDAVDPVLGEPRALRDALSCLFDNALKYRRPDTESQVWVDLRTDGPNALVAVRDNGLGVPVADRERIFERFVRVETDHRGFAGGHGLGLAQVNEIITAHRGTVRCVDGEDGGAAFEVRLPLHSR